MAVDDAGQADDMPAQQDTGGDSGVEEAVAPRGFSKLYTPSAEEFDRHCLTHLPYRNWCPICVQAKKKNPSHRRVKDKRGIPVFSFDYMFLNGRASLSNPVLS